MQDGEKGLRIALEITRTVRFFEIAGGQAECSNLFADFRRYLKSDWNLYGIGFHLAKKFSKSENLYCQNLAGHGTN